MDGQVIADGLPFQTQPHDAMRMGLFCLKDEALATHPAESIQQELKAQASTKQLEMMRQLYGTAVPAKYQIETQILSRFQRLPFAGMSSSKLGLESLTGELDTFSFESYLGLPQDSDTQPPDMHSQMEQRLGLGTKPVARGFF